MSKYLSIGQFILFFIIPIIDSLDCLPTLIDPDEIVI